MFLYKIAQERLLNIVLLTCLLIVLYIVNKNLTSTEYEIVKNISYSIIASIIFYYINGIYTSVKKDKYVRKLLISNYQQVRSDTLLYVSLCMPDRDRVHTSNGFYKNLENPIFFKNYFKYLRDGHKGMAPWSSFPYYQDTEVENIKKIFFSITQFNKLYLKHQHDVFLSSEARNYFNNVDRDINDYNNSPYIVFILVKEITTAYSWHLEKYFPEDPHLYFLRKENYMSNKWCYIKCYTISVYFIFWTLFAVNSFTEII